MLRHGRFRFSVEGPRRATLLLDPMLSDDVFRYKLQATIASLRYWVPQISGSARIEEEETEDFWRISLTPVVPGACPFELLLRESQHYDLALAGETYEDRQVESLDLFLPLAEAITEGRVIQRRATTTATGSEVEVESIVDLGNGQAWRGRRRIEPLFRATPPDGIEVTTVAFLPYRRGDGI